MKFNISPIELQRSMRMITLCSLGAAEADLSYGKIAGALGIPVEQVEGFVVEAIAQGLLEGSMDQFTGTLTVR